MKLYLSSYRVPHPEKLFALLDKVPEETKGVIVTNAKEKRTPEERALKLSELQNDLSAIGLKNTVGIDLRDGIPQLGQYDYVFAAGGNTFDLRRAMLETGFDEKIRDYLGNGGVYVGESAGAIVAGPSLRGFEMMDDKPENPIWDGMALVDTIIVPHNDSADPAYNNRAPEIQRANQTHLVTPLDDKEDYVINNR